MISVVILAEGTFEEPIDELRQKYALPPVIAIETWIVKRKEGGD